MSDPFAPGRPNTNAVNPLTGGVSQDEFFNFEDMIVEIPEGIHEARLTDMKNSTSKSNNPMIIWEFMIIKGPAAGQPISAFTAVTSNAIWKVQAFLAGLGLPPNGFKKSDAVNRMAHLLIVKEMYNGAPRMSISEIMPHPSGVGAKWQPGVGGLPTAPSDPVPDAYTNGGNETAPTVGNAGNPFATSAVDEEPAGEEGGEPPQSGETGLGKPSDGEEETEPGGEREAGDGEEAPSTLKPARKSRS